MALEIDRVREVAERVAASMGLEVVDVEFRGGGKARMLRITIDAPEGVTHEHCANVSRDVGTILDVEDVVPGGSYLLEVSSPGLDRKLSRPAEFQRFIGSLIKVMTREPINGNRHFEGRIESVRDGLITLALGGRRPAKGVKGKKHQEPPAEAQHLEIELANVEKANLVPEI
jgi:ribosome maturation factor RimP